MHFAACILLFTSFGIYFIPKGQKSFDYQLSKVSDRSYWKLPKQNVERQTFL
jgi:hypothetical protein